MYLYTSNAWNLFSWIITFSTHLLPLPFHYSCHLVLRLFLEEHWYTDRSSVRTHLRRAASLSRRKQSAPYSYIQQVQIFTPSTLLSNQQLPDIEQFMCHRFGGYHQTEETNHWSWWKHMLPLYTFSIVWASENARKQRYRQKSFAICFLWQILMLRHHFVWKRLLDHDFTTFKNSRLEVLISLPHHTLLLHLSLLLLICFRFPLV